MVLPFSVIYTICTPDQRFVFPSAVFNSLLAELWKKLCQRENRKAPGHLLQGILNVIVCRNLFKFYCAAKIRLDIKKNAIN
jgi:hypothetical protein